MPVTGIYLARRVHSSVLKYVKAYSECVLNNILPAFDRLSERSTEVGNIEFERLGMLPIGENSDWDMSIAAEAAQAKGEMFYNTMYSFRQSTMNLFAVGLFHLVEQQLADLCRDATFCAQPPADSNLKILKKWWHKNFGLNLEMLNHWEKIDQLRLIANCVKHAEGSSTTQLREVRADLFENPVLREMLTEFPKIYTANTLRRPLAGEYIYITREVFEEYSRNVNEFFLEITEHFKTSHDKQYL